MPRFSPPPLWLRPLVIVLLILGIFFRFVNIDRKVFWYDEVHTALRISGYDTYQAKTQMFTGKVIDIAAIQKFQKINPDKSIIRNTINTITSLATDDPQHPPLYYILTKAWVQLFGDSVTNLRIPSAIISIAVLPLAYWFCWELFHSSLVAWLAVSFFAVSPFQILYAQEAREYSLWTFMVLLVNIAFLITLRRQNFSSWAMYTLSLTASYYTSILSIPAAIGQGVYTLVQNKFQPNQVTINHLISGLISLVLFSPWLGIIIKYQNVVSTTTSWRNIEPFVWRTMLQIWGLNISTNFADIFLDINHISNYVFPLAFALLLAYAIYFLIKTTEQKVWLLLIVLLLSPVVYPIIPDIFMGTIVSYVSRYFIPWYVAIPIIFAYLISQKIIHNSIKKQLLWQAVFLGIITLSIISCTVSSQADTWWNKASLGNRTIQVAKIINQGVKPLVVADLNQGNFGDAIALSHRVNPQTKFQLITTPEMLAIPPGFSNIFFYNPADNLINKIKAEYGDKSIKTIEGTTLLELEPPSGLMTK